MKTYDVTGHVTIYARIDLQVDAEDADAAREAAQLEIYSAAFNGEGDKYAVEINYTNARES